MTEPEIYYEVHGEKEPYLLLVHGMLSSRSQWMPNIDGLRRFCSPVVVELFGHGRSPSPEDPLYYGPENYMREFEKVRQKVGVEKWFICGQSLGASLTLRYAIFHPDHIIAQIFTNSRSATSGAASDRGPGMLARRIEELGRRAIDEFPLHPAKGRHLSEEIRNALMEDVNRVTVMGFQNTATYTITNEGIQSQLPKTGIPTLLIAGRYDKTFYPHLDDVKEMIPGLEVIVLDAGHAVNIGQPENFNEAVKEFITKHREERK